MLNGHKLFGSIYYKVVRLQVKKICKYRLYKYGIYHIDMPNIYYKIYIKPVRNHFVVQRKLILKYSELWDIPSNIAQIQACY